MVQFSFNQTKVNVAVDPYENIPRYIMVLIYHGLPVSKYHGIIMSIYHGKFS